MPTRGHRATFHFEASSSLVETYRIARRKNCSFYEQKRKFPLFPVSEIKRLKLFSVFLIHVVLDISLKSCFV